MKSFYGQKNCKGSGHIRAVPDHQLQAARCVTVSRGDSIGHFAVHIEVPTGEKIRVSHDLTFQAANELKERYLQRRFYLQFEHSQSQ
jgi:hypothetical protein